MQSQGQACDGRGTRAIGDCGGASQALRGRRAGVWLGGSEGLQGWEKGLSPAPHESFLGVCFCTLRSTLSFCSVALLSVRQPGLLTLASALRARPPCSRGRGSCRCRFRAGKEKGEAGVQDTIYGWHGLGQRWRGKGADADQVPASGRG